MGLHPFSTMSQLLEAYTEAFTSQTQVVVVHNLGIKPVVWVEDASGNVIGAEVVQDSVNQFTVNFGVVQTGVIHYR